MDAKQIVAGALIGIALGFAVAWVAKPDAEPKQNTPSRPRETAERQGERPTGPKAMYTGDDITAARKAAAADADKEARDDERKKAKDAAQAELNAAKGEVQAREKKVGELEKSVVDLKKEIDDLKKAAAQGPIKKAPISWGKAGEVKEVGEADWADLAGAYAEINKNMVAIVQAMKEGKPIPPEIQKANQKANQRLIDYYVKILRKLPTHTNGNGEFVHPINTANLVGKTLETAGKPLTEAQMKRVIALGDEYEAAWDKAQAGYDANTLKLEKIVDEIELKQKFYDDMVALLQPDQRELIVNPDTHDYVQLDLYSPGLALVGNLGPVYRETTEDIRTVLIDECSKDWTVSKDLLSAQGFIFDNWFNECASMMEPRTGVELQFLKTQECIRYGRAQIKAVKALIEQIRPDEKQLALIRDSADIAILRVRKAQ